MKLACLRCKRKKIKCDKEEPVCHQCITAKTECQYVERRQRPRIAQQRVAVHHLNERLELLEQQITRSGTERSPTITVSESGRLSENTTSEDTVPSPKVSLTQGDGQESWIYRMASDVRRNFQSQGTPVSTPTPRIDDAMSSLNDALDDLGKLRIRTNVGKVDLTLSPGEITASIDAFIHLVSNMIVPELLTVPSGDMSILYMLPNIIKSPYVNVEPGIWVLYYNALYFGLQQIRGPTDPVAQGMYLKLLEAVPAWLDSPSDTNMDGYTAALTAWTAINNHDYQLSWRFHCKSCHYIKTKKIDQLDVVPARTFEEEDDRDSLRYLYWHVLSTDTLFRLFYGKPTVVRWVPNKVRPPAVMRSGNMHPSVHQVTMFVVWIRYTLMTAEMLNDIDNCPPTDRNGVIQEKVDDFCVGLENLMVEWKLDSIMKDMSQGELLRYLIADHVMNMYAIIIGFQRLVRPASTSSPIDAIALRAARKVAQITLDFTVEPAPHGTSLETAHYVCLHFISFYPFCAVFSLYEYILACTNPEECEQDVQLLESIGATMAEASVQRADFRPFERTINALNKVSRTIQDERRKAAARSSDPAAGEITNTMPEFDASAFASFLDFPLNFDDTSQPFGFVRALESDFTGRNWHEGWWDAGLDDPMAGLDGT
ncbi:hypothetical protein CC86DRAFT_310811 [Ophiobolus disseminans]|uniref:Zn(2)-C6 fungal-type domain-containing protein n=1 Tax=Ophiobolus disseminans TaxID=1469910 RepID=A0A6A7AJJ4_9PLEO|nr:hypothetical protein CC86DRAFT_310811 [Ophiobolus disseminans]